jgi:D-sedoheptulose 7-phosphate isomerase
MPELSSIEQSILDALKSRRPDLAGCVPGLLEVHAALIQCYDANGKLLICGNGGSHADAVHIAGELCKSFERKRPIPDAVRANLEGRPWAAELSAHLEAGLAAIPLGTSGALRTAVENDSELRDIAFAQEVCALARPEDVLLGISTSGNAANCQMAQTTARALGCDTVALTGPHGGDLAAHANISVKAPGESVAHIQEAHIALWHTMCLLIEAHYFPEKR